MMESGLVLESGAWRPGLTTAELMASAVDEAVEFIVSIAEVEAERGGARDAAFVLELLRAVDDGIGDGERRLAERASGDRCEVAVAELWRRRERLAALRERGGVLASKQGAMGKGSGLGRREEFGRLG